MGRVHRVVTTALVFCALTSCVPTAGLVDEAGPQIAPELQVVEVPALVDELVEAKRHLAAAEIRLDTALAATPYEREHYAPSGWADTDGDCQSDRHEVLIQESLVEVTLSPDGCRVEAGLWRDRLDGSTYQRAADVTIDHLVALSAAHRAGAWRWDSESKQRFASDISFAPAHGVTGTATNQAKGDREPDRWRPPLQNAWCSYAIDWIFVKTRWELMFTATEVEALSEMLATCPERGVTSDTGFVRSAHPVHAPTPSPTTPPTAIPVGLGPAMIVIGSCDARAEIVVLENRGGEPVDLAGWVLHDQGRRHLYVLEPFQIAPGGRLSIHTGSDATATQGAVVWKSENVWNNDGDTATLLSPAGVESSQQC